MLLFALDMKMNIFNNYTEGDLIKKSTLQVDLGALYQETIQEALDAKVIKPLGDHLFYKPIISRFGELPPTLKTVLSFIFENYPFSFKGGSYVYNSIGFSNQVPNLIQIYTNSQELVDLYQFKFIELCFFKPTINPEVRIIYPILELLDGDFCFWQDNMDPDDSIKSFIKNMSELEKYELIRTADEFYNNKVQQKLQLLLN